MAVTTSIQKPIVDDSDVWAKYCDTEIDIVIPYEKIDNGWNYADKPSYQHLNWFWNYVSQFIVHLNQEGIPKWDEKTVYSSGAITKYSDINFQSFQESINRNPLDYYRLWRREEHMNGLKDVNIDIPKNRDLLVYKYASLWINQRVTDVFDKSLGELDDVDDLVDSALENEILVYDSGTSLWTNKSILDAFDGQVDLADVESVEIDYINNPPTNYEVLKYSLVTVHDDYDDVDFETYKWTNGTYTGKINFNNIINLPDEFPCDIASKNKLGGLKLYTVPNNGNYILHIKTI